MKKKFFYSLLFTSILCTLVSCGDNSSSESSAPSKSELQTSRVEETSNNEKTTLETRVTSTVANQQVDTVDSSTYENLIKDFVDAYIINDRIKTLEYQAPDGFIDAVPSIWKTEVFEDYSEDEFLTEWQGCFYDNYNEELKWNNSTFKRIVSIEPFDDEDLLEDVKVTYGCMEWLQNYVNTNDVIDEDMIDFALSYDDEYIENTKITEANTVTVEIESEKTGEILQGKLLVYRVEGKEWKIYGYYTNFLADNKATANDIANRLLRAENSALCDLQEISSLPTSKDKFIISSVENKNYNLPDGFDLELLLEETQNWYRNNDLSEYEWFSVIDKNDIVYCVVINDSSKTVGMAHYRQSYDIIAEKISDDMTFDEVYSILIEEITK